MNVKYFRNDIGLVGIFDIYFNMVRLYDTIQDFKILQTLSVKLTWSHLLKFITSEDALKREFYITMCINEHWSVRALTDRINSMLYERTAISKKTKLTIVNDLKQLSEKNKMTIDFAFLGRQVRITVGQYLTLLPPKELFQEKLHKAIERAKESFGAKGLEE